MDRATRPTEVGQGWQSDPWQTHEYRYYSGGEATDWVATSGMITEEVVVSLEGLLSLQPEGDRLTVAEWGDFSPTESLAPGTDAPAAFFGQDERAEPTRTPVPPSRRGSVPTERDARRRTARRVSLAVIGTLAVLVSLAVLNASNGDRHVQSAARHHPAHPTSVDPTFQTTAPATPSVTSRLDT